MGSLVLAIKRSIVPMICAPFISERIFRWYKGRIPFRGLVIDTSHPQVPRSVVPRLFWKLYEKAEANFVGSHLRPNLPVIELGSCIGVVACLIAKRQQLDAQLVSVEANPNLRDVILENVHRNVPGKNYEVVTGAIDYSGAETVSFSVAADAVSSHVGQSSGMGDFEVPALQLGKLLANQGIDGPYALVCDIEAAEAGIILSDDSALENCQQIIIELHPGCYGPWNSDIESIKSALVGMHGFTLAASRGHVFVYER